MLRTFFSGLITLLLLGIYLELRRLARPSKLPAPAPKREWSDDEIIADLLRGIPVGPLPTSPDALIASLSMRDYRPKNRKRRSGRPGDSPANLPV